MRTLVTKVCKKCGKKFSKWEGGIVREPMSFQRSVCLKCKRNNASQFIKKVLEKDRII